jgi:prepilin-type N-terminal cleavage/methylation domain-containing protein/prepilin-type processing-associated H-X9-DG protein
MQARFRRTAFSLVELMVVIAVITVLVSLASWGISKARDSARAGQCGNSLKQIGVAFQQYVAANHKSPDAATVLAGLDSYLSNNRSVYSCPIVVNSAAAEVVSYGVNPCVHRMMTDAGKVLMVDANSDMIDYESLDTATFQRDVAGRHYDMANVLYIDGRVERTSVDDINPYRTPDGEQIRTTLWKPRIGGCSCAGAGTAGLLGEYWANPDQWSGTSWKRLEKTIDLPFGNQDFFGVPYSIPIPGATASNPFPLKTARFSGFLRAETSEPYTFHVCCDNAAWVTVNGVQVVSRSTGGPGPVQEWQAAATPINLAAGRWYDFEVRWLEEGPGSPGHVKVHWSRPSSPGRTPIPITNFRPPRGIIQ